MSKHKLYESILVELRLIGSYPKNYYDQDFVIIAKQFIIIKKCYRILELSVVAMSGPEFCQYVYGSALVNVQKKTVKLGCKTHTEKYTDQPNSTCMIQTTNIKQITIITDQFVNKHCL